MKQSNLFAIVIIVLAIMAAWFLRGFIIPVLITAALILGIIFLWQKITGK